MCVAPGKGVELKGRTGVSPGMVMKLFWVYVSVCVGRLCVGGEGGGRVCVRAFKVGGGQEEPHMIGCHEKFTHTCGNSITLIHTIFFSPSFSPVICGRNFIPPFFTWILSI